MEIKNVLQEKSFFHFLSSLELNKTNMSELRLEPVTGRFYYIIQKKLEWFIRWSYIPFYNYIPLTRITKDVSFGTSVVKNICTQYIITSTLPVDK